MRDPFDAVVIGAGVVGLFTAYELATRGLSVAVVEKMEKPGLGVTSKSANVIHVIQPPLYGAKHRLAVEGNRLYDEYSDLLGFKVNRLKALLAVTGPSPRAAAWLAWRLLKARLPSWASPRLMRWREASEIEPALAPATDWFIAVDGYGVVDPAEVVASLERALRKQGASFNLNAEAEGLEKSSKGVVVRLSDGTRLDARVVVNAAGLEAATVASWAGDRYEVKPIPGMMTIHSRPKLKTIVSSIRIPPRRGTKGGGAIPQVDGRLLLGPTYSPEGRPEDPSVLVGRFQLLLEPEIGDVEEVIVGDRPAAADRKFHIEYSKTYGVRLIHLVGIESPGLTAAPAIARIVASMASRALASGGRGRASSR